MQGVQENEDPDRKDCKKLSSYDHSLVLCLQSIPDGTLTTFSFTVGNIRI